MMAYSAAPHAVFVCPFLVLVLTVVPVFSMRKRIEENGSRLPHNGAWKYDKTHWLAREQLGKCIHPELEYENLTWLDELRDASSKARQTQEFHSQSWDRPLTSIFGKIADYLPHHRAIILTSGRYTRKDIPEGLDYPGSRCYDFDYDAPANSIPDPHGCSLFRHSFSRLKKLRTCVVGALEKSPRWLAYRQMVRTILARRTPNSTNVENPDAIQIGDEIVDEELQNIGTACRSNSKCVLVDAFRRVDEMIKYLNFQSWVTQKKPLRTWVESKVRYTASIYNEGADQPKQLGIEQDVVDTIVESCFGVPKDADSMTYDQLPKETKLLERSLSCNAIMLDQIHVPGAPQPPVTDAVTMWDPLLANKGKLLFDLKSTTPVCGRAAAAMAIYGQTHSKKGYTIKECTMGTSEDKPWKECADVSGFNCICLELCWRKALQRVCDIAPSCC